MVGDRNTAEYEVQGLADEWVGVIQRESAARVRIRENLDLIVFPHGKRASSDAFSWKTTSEETFHFNGAAYDVSAAKEIIRSKPRSIRTFRTEEAAPLLPNMPDESVRRTLSFGVEIDWPRVENGGSIDLSIPVIVVTNGSANRLPIDGFHRVARARFLWVRDLPCVILTAAETDRIRLPYPR